MGSDRLQRRTRRFLKPEDYQRYLDTLVSDPNKNSFVCDVANKVIRSIRVQDIKDPNACVLACDYVWDAPPAEIPEHDKPYVVTKIIYWHNRQR